MVVSMVVDTRVGVEVGADVGKTGSQNKYRPPPLPPEPEHVRYNFPSTPTATVRGSRHGTVVLKDDEDPDWSNLNTVLSVWWHAKYTFPLVSVVT